MRHQNGTIAVLKKGGKNDMALGADVSGGYCGVRLSPASEGGEENVPWGAVPEVESDNMKGQYPDGEVPGDKNLPARRWGKK